MSDSVGPYSTAEMVMGESAESILKRSFEPIQQVCGPLTTACVGIISGEPGVGKSFWVLDMMAHIGAGADFESWKVPKSRGVIYVDGEMPGTFIQARLRHMPETPNLTVIYEDWLAERGLPHVDMGVDDWQAMFLSPLYQSAYDVFVFDTTSSCMSAAPGSDEWKPEYWHQVQNFNRRMRANGKTVIWIDHLNKQGQTQGTSAKKRGIEFEWLLEHWDCPHGRAAFHLEVGKDRQAPGKTAKSKWQHLEHYGWRIGD